MTPPRYEMSAEEYRQAADGTLSEDTWQKSVEEALRHYGWTILLRFHDRAMYSLWKLCGDNRALRQILQQLDGWPDVLASHPVHGQMWIEFKTNKGDVRANQKAMITQIRSAGGTVFVLRPRHRDRVDDLLQGRHLDDRGRHLDDI